MNSEKAFLGNRPELKNILQNHGKKTVSEYISFVNQSVSDIDFSYFEPRMEEFFEVYRETLSPIFEQSVINHSIETLKKNRLISTADHQGVINHPFSINGTYVRTLYAKDASQSSVITFPCASISLSNSSFPRGLMIHDTSNSEKKIYFKSLIHKQNPVFSEEKVDRNTVQKMYDTLSSISLEMEARKKILSTFKEIFFSENFLSLESFDDQCAYGSLRFWQSISGFENMDLIYVSQEKLVVNLIVNKHLNNKTFIHSLLFDARWRDLFVQYFEGIQGAFDTQEKKGTHLFWGIRNRERVSLFIQGDNLIDSDGKLFVLLKDEEIKKALLEKRIMPAMPLCFIVLSFYYGFVCGGGFSQVDYLGEMKQAWMEILKEMGQGNEFAEVEKLPTNIYLGDFAFLKQSIGKLMSSLDLVVSHRDIIEKQKNTTLSDAYTNLVSEFLKIHF